MWYEKWLLRFDCFFFLPFLMRHRSDLQSICPVSWHQAPHCWCHSSLPPSVNTALSPQQPASRPYVWRALLLESGLKNICPLPVLSMSPHSPATASRQSFSPTPFCSQSVQWGCEALTAVPSSTCTVVSIPLFRAVCKTNVDFSWRRSDCKNCILAVTS